jgi:hypothetical protein
VQATALDGEGALWLGTTEGISRVVSGGAKEAGTLFSYAAIQDYRGVLANHGTLILSRPAGLSYLKHPEPPIALPNVPAGAEAKLLALGQDGAVWVGTDLGGLLLRKPGQDLHLIKEAGLPSMTVTALAAVPPNNAHAWVGTTAGAVLVGMSGQSLRVERTITWEGMPTGPVDALVPAGDGGVFIAYNAIPAKRFVDPDLAARRARTRVWYVAPDGKEKEIPATDAFAQSNVRALSFSEKHGLWAGTSAGLFVSATRDAGFQPAGQGRLTATPIRHLGIANDKAHTLWMSTDKQGDAPPSVVGFRPTTNEVYNLTQEHGIPKGDVIDDLTFTDEGELVVLVGSHLAKGRVFVPITPPAKTPLGTLVALVLAAALAGVVTTTLIIRRTSSLPARIRRRPRTLIELPLAAVPAAVEALHRARTLDEIWTQLALPARSRLLAVPLASTATPGAAQLRALAELLGMEAGTTALITEHPHGLTMLAARLPSPQPLRDHPIALIALDLAEARQADPARVREALESALKQAGHRFELPFLLLAAGDPPRDIIPADYAYLHLGERELKSLLFARSPEQTFAGLLHTRGLIALSPYDTSGAVKEEPMFFGRIALLRELLLATSVQQIIVGPRRVGKTSLLKNLQRELPARRADTEVVFLDLLGIKDLHKAARNLARLLDTPLPADADPDTALADLLRARFQRAANKAVILIDEADGIAETDARKGFPLFSAMRTLQAEGVCSFVLAGYLFLYREALNQRSPLYNFANLRLLGPLEPEAARDLALVPMQRLGVAYADPELPARIAERTGGYPSFVQLLCDALLKELKGGDLTLTAAHLERAEKSPRVRGELDDMFRLNAAETTQIAVYGLLDRDSFTRADAEGSLARALGKTAPVAVVEQALLELRVFGFAVEHDGRLSWAIPLLRETLRRADPELASKRLVEELAAAKTDAAG